MAKTTIDRYTPQTIEAKWQKRWEDDQIYRAVIDTTRPKHYALTMLPYPSGDLHIGHWYAMAPSDAHARFMRMKGYNVMFPMGFDAFGLPAENAAIKQGIHPYKWTMANIGNMRKQLRSMGGMFDWEREAISCLPGYYKWSQWFFLKAYEMDLAYRAFAPVDFCPNCNTTLAREQVWGEDRHCERCETPVIKKELNQWFYRITNYAEELLDYSKIDWPERVITMQKNWIGKSTGAQVTFKSEQDDDIIVFTTRPDTLWGATFMVLAPEHPLVDSLTAPAYREGVEEYQRQTARRSEIERLTIEKDKTGVFVGAYAINPVNSKRIPIYISDYVMMTYGTGAIMAVPAHDERDFAFALKYGLPIIPVIERQDQVGKSLAPKGTMREGIAETLASEGFTFTKKNGAFYVTLDRSQIDRYIEIARKYLQPGCWNEIVGTGWFFVFEDGVAEFNSVQADHEILSRCKGLEPGVTECRTVMEMLSQEPFYTGMLFHADYGAMINSGELSDTPGDDAVQRTIAWLEEKGTGKSAINYRLRDWLISRQRYWGTPIPIVYCPKCGTVPIPYEDLPVLLPEDAKFMPTGESPLKYHEGFRYTTCPKCGGPAEREMDTMDTFICSSWYWYAYLSPYYEGDQPFDPEEADYWLPVDVYTGGIEHATMHLLYARFYTKVMRDIGLIDLDEPMLMLRNQGMILGEDNEKMSKSRGNVIAPDSLVQRYGADTVRGYLMFGWRWYLGGPWDSHSIEGMTRFLDRVWNCVLAEPTNGAKDKPSQEDISSLRRKVHQSIRKATKDMESFSFNTYIANMMELNNAMLKAKETSLHGTKAWEEAVETLLLLLAPPCPHVAEELWARTGRPYSIHQQSWPEWNPDLAADETFTLVVQINGKVRDRMEVPVDIEKQQAIEMALASDGASRHTEGKDILKVIYIPGRLVNVVVR